MTNQNAVDYVRNMLGQDFGSESAIIETWLENRLKDLDDEWIPIVDEEQAEFQSILELIAYPFLACYKALIDADVPEKNARNYCKMIWKKMPVSNMTASVENPIFH